jgi:indolepyruvate ferredoxin oxidoreductase
MEDPSTFVWINDLVCEGCGDCSVASNCLSVEPRETPLGRKRKINLSSCNKDFSCLNGFCPSFVTVEGATRRKRAIEMDFNALETGLPDPKLPSLDTPFDLLVTGVGGTGVVTVGALITMAAHLEGKGASVLDFTGFAQKFGTVLSYIRLGAAPDALNQVRIDQGAADAVIGCDVVVSSAPKASAHYARGTRVVLNRAEMPTGDLVLRRDAQLRVDKREQAIADVVGVDNLASLDANAIAEALLGDSVFANVILLGYAWQNELVPVSHLALAQAILLNGVAVEKNRLAFALGRCLAADPDRIHGLALPEEANGTLDQVIARRVAFLTDYQDAAYADRYAQQIEALRASNPKISDDILESVARNLFRFMAYKDEFEVARLQTSQNFDNELKQQFEGDFKTSYHFAPPMLSWRKDERGRPLKFALGPWMRPVLRGLSRLRGLRGSVLNPFGYHSEARLHRDILNWYQSLLGMYLTNPSAHSEAEWLDVLSAADQIRGFGPVREESYKKARAMAR